MSSPAGGPGGGSPANNNTPIAGSGHKLIALDLTKSPPASGGAAGMPREKLKRSKKLTATHSSQYRPRTNVEFQQLPLLKGMHSLYSLFFLYTPLILGICCCF